MKKQLLLLTMVMALTLTGCAGVKDYLGDKMLQKSGVLDDANYHEYEQYAAAGQLDVDGYYIEETAEVTRSHPQVWVTFSENNNLDIQYYTDSSHRTAVDWTNCYVDPGDSIYAVVSTDDGVFSSMYSFSAFRVYEYDSEGSRKQSTALEMKLVDDEYVLTIPDDFEGTSISLEPVGEYSQRSIALNDYYSDDAGNQHTLAGTWIVNDKECTADTVEISPVTSYIISYEYGSDEYFYLSSSPECYYASNVDGVVIFNQRDADDETADYSVELHKYFSTTLVSDTYRTVKVNGGDAITISANGELPLDHLKYGDTVTLETNKSWAGLENNREIILTSTEPLSSGEYKYTFIVPEKDGEFIFSPRDYKYDHGTITFKCFGQTVTSTQILAKGSKIYYEQASADKGYWLAGTASEHYIIVGDEKETTDALKAIHFTQMVDVTVNLPQPKVGGSIIYKLNGTRVYGSSVSTNSGAVITMKFDPWEGWMSNVTGEAQYHVGDSKSQTVKVNGSSIDSVLTEDEKHKPALTLNFEKSVGETMEFTLKASGYSMDVESYGGGWKVADIFDKDSGTYDLITNKQIIIDGQKIGTGAPIQITMAKRAIQSGTAARMVIVKTDDKGNKTSETRYIDDLSETLDPIYIYQSGTNATSTVWYKSVEITIGVVDIEKFAQPNASANTKVTVVNNSTGETLATGDLIEADTKVVVTITPLSGYYVTGKNVSNDVYSKTMKFSEYQKNISTIISEHPADKYYTITLDKSDAYASYIYKLDGKEVSGMIYVKAGQKLELTYEITDPAYKLSTAHGGLVFGIGSSTTKATETITIDSNMHGKTITKTEFNIDTVKGG